MPNYWKTQGIPHKGWRLINVIDIREDGQSEWDTNYESCMMCGNEKIRYVHIVSHDEVAEEFSVGCNCAARMTDDYVNPERREAELRNRANRRINWSKKQWKYSKSDNLFLNYENHFLLVFKDKYSAKFKIRIDERVSKKTYDDIDLAKIAVFKNIEHLKENDKW
ncbi:MAG: hypothetical protein ACYC25_00815 [Paludibacter sp.]